MLTKSDTSIDNIIAELARFGLEAGYIVPTDTGLKKSIIDAHEGIRRFLKSKSLHDFDQQKQGPDHKREMPVKLVLPDRTEDRLLTLYRPRTKSGDPRMWIGRLGEYANPFNLIALVHDPQGSMHIVNCSCSDVWESRTRSGSPLYKLLHSAKISDAANELLEMLRDISAMGFVKSLRDGDTGVGYTLETLLGIPANSSRNPDFKGIELKSSRVSFSGRPKNRADLFAKVPNWKISNLKSGKEIINTYGYFSAEAQRTQLYCTLKDVPNPQGLFLQVDSTGTKVENLARKTDGSEVPVVVWMLDDLESALTTKHPETFWVKAQVRSGGSPEEFHYVSVTHTRTPLASNFGLLIDSGKIEVDYVMHLEPNGRARDHGYKFKIWPKNFDLLFPPPLTYDLTA